MNALTIKPSLACTADCPGCASRRSLHRSVRGETLLSYGDWVRIMEDGRSLGAELLTISGGEPTLYRELPQLIREAVGLGYKVVVNTNGSRIVPEYAETLAKAGVHAVRISIYSRSGEVHDSIRRCRGLHSKACEAVKIFSNLRETYQGLGVWTQAIILRENIRTLDELVRFHHELGSENLLLSYLEGDFERRMLVSRDDILFFRQSVLPKVLRFSSKLDETVRETARERMLAVYDLAETSVEDFSRGVYQREKTCDRPRTFALVLANGDVHPCDIVEYTHEPVMGNLLHERLPAIWQSDRWSSFRNSLHEKCHLCPKNLHTTIPLRRTTPERQPLMELIKRRVKQFLGTRFRGNASLKSASE